MLGKHVEFNMIENPEANELNEIIYKKIKLKELITYLNENQLWNKEIIKKTNPKIIAPDGTIHVKVGNMKNGRAKMVCPGHPTARDNSTNILLEVNKITCFRGGCVCERPGLNVVQFYMCFKMGIAPELVTNPEIYKNLKREKFQAKKELLELAGYRIKPPKKVLTSLKELREKRKQEILKKAIELYHQEFLQNEEGKKYFLEAEYIGPDGQVKKGRGFKYIAGEEHAMQAASRFKIGFAPNPFPSTWLYDKLASEYTTEELLDASVVNWLEANEKAVDFHSRGLIMPYWKGNQVTNIYSRLVDTTAKKMRHLRLPGTVDLPIHFEEASRFETVQIVEGELTWFTCILFGYENTMGNRGTNGLSEEHVKLLKTTRDESGGKLCKTIVLAFDGDEPGVKATIKTGKMLLDEGFDVRVVRMPEGMDHNDLVLKYRDKAKSIYEKLYSEKISYYAFLALAKVKEAKNQDISGILHEIKEILPSLSDDEMYIVAKEFSEVSKIPLETIWGSWRRKNEKVENFHQSKYVFITKDIETFHLIKFAFGEEKAVYLEDTSFSFVSRPLSVKTVIADEKYEGEEFAKIKEFCANNKIQLLKFNKEELKKAITFQIDQSKLTSLIRKY